MDFEKEETQKNDAATVAGFAVMAPLCPAGRAFVLVILAGTCFAAVLPSEKGPHIDPPAASIDLRPVLDAWGLKPRLQGERGTCSVFALVGALDYAHARKTGQGVPLSVEYLNWASNQAVQHAVDGGFFSDLWKGFAGYGICPEQEMPYQAHFDPNLMPTEEARAHALEFLRSDFRLHWIKPWDVNTELTEEQLGVLKQTLNRQWPVCGGFRWPKAAKRWNTDILITPPPEGVFDGHSVLIVGYHDDPNQPGGGLLLFRDSNFTGPAAIRRMTYRYAFAYLNDAVWIDYKTDADKSCDESCLPDTEEAGCRTTRANAVELRHPPKKRIQPPRSES